MTTSSPKQLFLDSDKARQLRQELVDIAKAPEYNIQPYGQFHDPDSDYFVEKHMRYMSLHPTMDHWQYVSNLKLMMKIQA